MIEFERRKKVRLFLNITPLIDVVFLLLIFFMLSSHFIIHPGIKINLPVSKTAKYQKEENIIIFINKENQIFINNRKISIDELKDVLKERLKTTSTKTVIVKADEKIELGLAVKVIDISKESGAKGVVISTKKNER